MKSQNDMIFMGGAIFVLLVWGILNWTVMKRQVVAPTPPTPVTVTDAPLPTAAPVMAAALPQGGGSGGGRSAMGGLASFGAPGGSFGPASSGVAGVPAGNASKRMGAARPGPQAPGGRGGDK